MAGILIPIQIMSIYKNKNKERIFLPLPFAQCTPDTLTAWMNIEAEVKKRGGELFLSDMFRTFDMQLQASLDSQSGKKKAFSPPPVGSMHEAGRAVDIDLRNIKIELAEFWDIAKELGVFPIIKTPDKKLNEAWHFDCPGSHKLVFDYYRERKASNLLPPYRAMSISAVLAAGLHVNLFEGKIREARIQSGLIRLGFDIGPIDGLIGKKTFAVLEEAGVPAAMDLDTKLTTVEFMLKEKFPQEYFHEDTTELAVSTPSRLNIMGNSPV